MPFQVSPGVNVSEIDLTTVVPAVSTTEGAIAGQFRWGPVEERVLVDTEDRLVSVFQKPNSNNAVDFFTAANFLSYGNALNVVRIVGASAMNASSGGDVDALIKNDDSAIPETDTFYARYPGYLGNSLKTSICPTATAWQETLSTPYAIANGSKTVVFTTAGSNNDDKDTAANALNANLSVGDIVELGTNADHSSRIVSSVVTAAGSNGDVAIVTVTIADTYLGVAVTAGTNFIRKWEYFNNFDDAPGTSAVAATRGGADDEIHIAVVDEDGLISGVKGAVLETYAGVSLAIDGKTSEGAGNFYRNVINQSSSFIRASDKTLYGQDGTKTAVQDFGINAFKLTGAVPANVDSESFTQGHDGADLTSVQKIPGYDLFKSAEDVDVSFLLGGNADVTLATYLITNIAESRKDCLAVISPEYADVVNNNSYAGKETKDVIAFRDSLPSSSYAVLDSGWKYQYDKYNDVYRYVPLNADTAGLMVQTDNTRDPWYSPAGFNRGNVKNAIKLAYNPTKGDRDALYKKGINPVVTFPGQGTVLFGDKTLLAKPSAFDRINVRRLFIVLEKAISTASKFTLFEFNDEFTRSQFKNLVEPFLRDVQGRRGITDFVVVCDGTNNTGEVVDRNEFIGDIYIKPARSINFIQLNFVAVRSGVEFSEIVGRA
jgi:hypothetical protein